MSLYEDNLDTFSIASGLGERFEVDQKPAEEAEPSVILFNDINPYNSLVNNQSQKKTEFKLDRTDSEEEQSEDENYNSSQNNSEQINNNPASKLKREPKKKRQEYAEFWPCVEILVKIYYECIFDVKKFSELTQEQKEVVLSYLDKILTKERLNELKSFLLKQSLNSMNPLKLKTTDFCVKKSRIDEVLKLVTSQALKKLYHNYMKNNGINKSFNPKKYTKRANINRMIYMHYFKKEPLSDEHMKLFLIKNGVTREWFDGAVCGLKKNSAFIEDLLKILRDEKFFDFYKSKIDSMIRRILGVVEFAEEQELLNNEVEKAKKIKSKLDGGSDTIKAKKPKMPCHRYLFQQCIKDTIQKIEELADEKQIKLSNKKC